ncbi:hypothetical protein [Sulfurimonas microaerophilic]|uniref:hypothetical protein n=1 Tax=Sulfurimonas microaerophilic TaxID=3058392 RepID=UPI0027152E99|nr:hypothetical protein [Sulfurimonas sp. hsl 1-7]
MEQIIASFKEFLDSRVKNMFFMNFVFAWIIINYNITLRLAFSSETIQEKISFLNKLEFSWWSYIFFPLSIALLYIYLIPLINLGIVKLYDSYIHYWIKEHEHQKRIQSFLHKKKEEEARHNAVTFVKRDMEQQKKVEENNEKQRAIDLEKEIIKVLEYKKNLEQQKINDKTKELQNEIKNLKSRNENLIDHFKALQSTLERIDLVLSMTEGADNELTNSLSKRISELKNAIDVALETTTNLQEK